MFSINNKNETKRILTLKAHTLLSITMVTLIDSDLYLTHVCESNNLHNINILQQFIIGYV